MLETDVQSRNRLRLLGIFLLLLFGGFALFGAVQRLVERAHWSGSALGEAVQFAPDRAANIAEQKRWFATRKKMATAGKSGKWKDAIAIADTYLAQIDDNRIRLFRAEALFRIDPSQGGPELARLLTDRMDITPGEVALYRGDTDAYRRGCSTQLKQIDDAKASAMDANNTAWWCTIGPDGLNKADMDHVVQLSERAVADARSQHEIENLATFTNTLGTAYLRAGRYPEAVTALTESERLRHDPFNYALLALAQHDNGKESEAVIWRDRLRNHLTNTYATRDGQNGRFELLLLWRETESTLK